VIAGKIIGGKPGEAPQEPEAYTITEDGFVLHFGGTYLVTLTEPDGTEHMNRQRGTETLAVIHPSAVQISPAGDLIVPRAGEARFGWHSYGRLQTEENWCVRIYRLQGAEVEWTALGPIRAYLRTTLPARFPYEGAAFVQLTQGG
jgi:hypothetical protein